MLRIPSHVSALLVLLATLLSTHSAQAVRPSETLLPEETKGFVSVPDVDRLRTRFDASQWGQLMADPSMEPFLEDLERQLRSKFEESGRKLGLTWEDIENVYGGEVCMAAIQPDNVIGTAAVAMIVDVTDHLAEADELMDKIERNMQERGATQVERVVGEITMVVYTLPVERGEEVAREAVLFIHENQLVAIDNDALAGEVAARFADDTITSLASTEAFQGSFARVIDRSQGRPPEIRWFVEPIGYAYVSRVLSDRPQRRGTDLLKVLANQGFGCIQGVAGHVNFSTGEEELLHRTMVYAPGEFELAARILNFSNRGDLTPQAWITRELATYASFNWDMQDAFDHIDTLVDEFSGEPGFFDDLLESIKNDPNGPRIDVPNDLIAHLGNRVTVVTDYTLPITTECERLLAAIEVTDAAAVQQTVDNAMNNDPDVTKRTYRGYDIWEIVEKEEYEVPQLEFEGPGFGPSPGFGTPPDENDPEAEERIISNAAVAVAHGHLLIATHVDFLVKILDDIPATDRLNQADDYQLVAGELQRFATGDYAFRFFSRTDEEFRPTFELIRQGKMPESKTMLGKLLNYMFGPEDEEELREQAIDGTKLPEYDNVRRYFGPSGMIVRRVEEGWLLEGLTLTKMVGPLVEHSDPEVETAFLED